MLVLLAQVLTACSNPYPPPTPDPTLPPKDWPTQLAVAAHYAAQMGPDPVLIRVMARPATDNWVGDPQHIPILESSFYFADARKSSATALAVTTVRFSNPPITGTIETDPDISWETVPITGYPQQRLGMRDAFATMKAGPQDVYRITAPDGLRFLGAIRSAQALSIGAFDVQEWDLAQAIPVEKRANLPSIVWIAGYFANAHQLRFIINPYTGEVLERDTR